MSNKGKDYMTDNNNSYHNSSDHNTSDKQNNTDKPKTKKNSFNFKKYRSSTSSSKNDKNNPKNTKKRKFNKKSNNQNNTDNFKSESNGDSKYEVIVGLFKELLKLVVISFVFSFLCERYIRSYVEKCVSDTFDKRFGTAAETQTNQ